MGCGGTQKWNHNDLEATLDNAGNFAVSVFGDAYYRSHYLACRGVGSFGTFGTGAASAPES